MGKVSHTPLHLSFNDGKAGGFCSDQFTYKDEKCEGRAADGLLVIGGGATVLLLRERALAVQM